MAEVEATRTAAQSLIKNASETQAADLSFAGPNRRLLGLEGLSTILRDQPPSRTLYFCNFDGNIGVSRSAHRCLRGSGAHVVEDKCDRDKGLSVVDWVRSGSLGELPG
jgi:hypothetical protein